MPFRHSILSILLAGAALPAFAASQNNFDKRMSAILSERPATTELLELSKKLRPTEDGKVSLTISLCAIEEDSSDRTDCILNALEEVTPDRVLDYTYLSNVAALLSSSQTYGELMDFFDHLENDGQASIVMSIIACQNRDDEARQCILDNVLEQNR